MATPFHLIAILLFPTLALYPPVLSSEIHAYPSAGQSREQQNKDEWNCHQWAVDRTGLDPIKLADKESPPASGDPETVAQGAEKGVFHGLLAGAIRGGNLAEARRSEPAAGR